MKVKVCGLKYQSNIEELIQLPIDYMGLIFYEKSPRFVNINLGFDFIRTIPKHIKKVGVFVNENSYSICDKVAHYDLDIVQLHGDESSGLCAELKSHAKVMKVFQVNEGFDFKQLEKYISDVDYFLFDTPTVNYGGSGKAFNWKLLKNYSYNIPFFLSGGISEEHIEKIKKLKIPQLIGIDINSKFEIEPGLKNKNKIKEFIDKLNNYDNK